MGVAQSPVSLIRSQHHGRLGSFLFFFSELSPLPLFLDEPSPPCFSPGLPRRRNPGLRVHYFLLIKQSKCVRSSFCFPELQSLALYRVDGLRGRQRDSAWVRLLNTGRAFLLALLFFPFSFLTASSIQVLIRSIIVE